MATAAREDKKQSYQGTGGKFRKTPFRRSTQSTPYDRPSTAAAATLRTPSTATSGWISKLVDPAQRLLSYSAHRLFSSVFTKRLPPPPPPTETSHEAKSKRKEEVSMDPPGVQRYAIDQSAGPSTTQDGNGFTLLEQILEQKTFTRPEIDRMKELLHSRTVDIPHENQEERSEVLPSKAVASHDRKEEYSETPLQDKSGINSHFVSTPVVSTSVLDEEGVSPVELAKAYMSSRASKVSPSMLGVLNQAPHENVHVLSSVPNSSKLPLMSASKICGNGGAPENGFATPRSRGRSAICNMAQTPYSRVRTYSTVKGVGSTYDTHGWISLSSQSVQEQSQLSGSKQGALKRRFSVLDNDIGSVGPIRRIRLKPNLVSSRGLSTPISSSAVSIRGTQLPLEAAQNPPSSTQKPLWLSKSKHIPAKALSENGVAVPSTSFSTVPSQSSKTASKIFEHLDKIISPKEKLYEPKDLPVRDKSPTKLSPSMLRGQALKSLEDVDSSRYLENICSNISNNVDISSNLLKTDATKKDDKVKENGPSRNIVPSDTSAIITNGAASDTVPLPSAKERAFKMSAHEYLELDDDDDCSAYVAGSGTFSDGRVKVDKIEVVTQDKLPAISEVKPPAYPEVKSPSSFERNPMAETGISDCVYRVAARETNSVRKPVESDTDGKSKSDAQVSFRVPELAVSSSSGAATTSVNATATPFFNNLASQKSPEVMAFSAKTNSVDNNATTSAIATSSSSLFNSVTAPPPPAEHIFKFCSTAMQDPANSSMESLGDTNKIDGCVANLSGTSSAGTSSAGTSAMSASIRSTFGFPATTVNLLNSTSLTTGSGSGLSTEASPGSIWSFRPSTASTAMTPAISDWESSRDENKQGGTLGTVSSASFPGTSATSASSAISSFGASVPASTPTSTQQSLGTIVSGSSGSGSNVQVLPAGTGIGSITETAPAPGSSASGFAFIFTGDTALSSGSLALGASTAMEASLISSNAGGSSKLFSAGWQPPTSSKFASTISSTSSSPGFQFSASSASAATNATPSFGLSSGSAATSSNATTVLGMPSASAPSTSSSPVTFGASTVFAPSTSSTSVFGLSNGGSSAHTFSFGSPATTTTPSQPAFSNPIFGFPTAPLGSNDQTSMEDSMAEDTVHASAPTFPRFGQQPVSAPQSTPTLPVFGQQPVSAPQSAVTAPVFGQQPFSAPQSTSTVPVFGQHPVSAPHSAPNVFGQQPVSTPQSPFVFGSNTGFQFQTQPNIANSQTPSIFQASSSLGLSTGGGGSESNFSLGSGGGDKSNRRFIKANRSKNRKK